MTDNTPRDIDQLPFFSAQPLQPSSAPVAGPGGHLLAASVPTPAPLAEQPSQQTPVVAPPVQAPNPTDQLDWETVAKLRDEVSSLLSSSIQSNPNMTEPEQQAIAQSHIHEVIRGLNEDHVRIGGENSAWNGQTQGAIARAVFDALFKLGRLQPLVDAADVENIDIYGHDNVYVTYATGEVKKHPPIAKSDNDLINELAFLAARGGEAGRSFTATNPILDMDLPGGARLAAVAPPISPRPKAVIRVHRFVDVALADLVEKRTLTHAAAEFLRASVRAGLSAVVSGAPGAGKTTLLRALAGALDPFEKIVTIEKERELYLERMGARHLIVTALQYRQGQGERTADGSRPGEISLVDLLEEALRLDAERIIIGEVRGGEIDAMFQAMQAGVGSLSTLHAMSPTNAIERMATLTQRSLNTSDAYAYRQIQQHIDLLVQVRKIRDRETGMLRRVVTEIAEVQPGGDSAGASRPIAAPIFRADPRTFELTPVGRPTEQLLDEVEHAGFQRDLLLPREREVA